MQRIKTAVSSDGTLTYAIDHAPAALPAVLSRDLLRVWDAARQAALSEQKAPARAFRFNGLNGRITAMVLTDRDATCWAGAADAAHPITTAYGMSLCLRLLALIDLLARAPWAASLARITRGGTQLDPALLRLAAAAVLDDDGGFDAPALQASLNRLPNPGPAGRSRQPGAHA